MAFNSIKDGEFTKTIYNMVTSYTYLYHYFVMLEMFSVSFKQIKDERYHDAITTLVTIVDANPTVRKCSAT